MQDILGTPLPAGFPGLPEGWKTEPRTFQSDDGKVKLFALLHRKSATPLRRLLIVAHGFGEHGGRYGHFPHYLEHKFDAILAADHRGHGRSEGQRGHAERFDLLVDDLVKIYREMNAELSKRSQAPAAMSKGSQAPVEIHLLGHSMGGHVALRLAYLHPDLGLKAIQVSSPFLALKAPVNPVKRGVARLLSPIWGNLSLRADFDVSMLSHDVNVQQNYSADRLNHDRMTPQMYVSMNAAMQDTRKNFKVCAYPIQFLIPTEDPLVDSAVSRSFYERLQAKEKKLVDLPGFRHEPMNELEKEKFFTAVLDFPSE